MHLEGPLRILVRDHFDGPRIRSDKHNVLTGQPTGGFQADPRFARTIGLVVLHPQLAMTGTQKNCVTFAQSHTFGMQRILDIFGRDNLTGF